jgi:hypothetical protein
MIEAIETEYETEEKAMAALDERLAACELFKVYREVAGFPTQPRQGSDLKTMRIDRLLVPTQKLLASGWANGVIGIEGKKSVAKLGRTIAQCEDYRRAVWELPTGNIAVQASWVFVWPCRPVGCDLQSIMVQNRIGTVSESPWFHLVFQVGSERMLGINPDLTFQHRDMTGVGRKAGSR